MIPIQPTASGARLASVAAPATAVPGAPAAQAPVLLDLAPRQLVTNRARDLYARVIAESRRAGRHLSMSSASSGQSHAHSDPAVPKLYAPTAAGVVPRARPPLLGANSGRSLTEPPGASFARWGQTDWQAEVDLAPTADLTELGREALLERAEQLAQLADLLRQRQDQLRQLQYAAGLKVTNYKARFVSTPQMPQEPLIDADLQRQWDEINRALLPGLHPNAPQGSMGETQNVIFLGQMRARVASLREDQNHVEALCREALAGSPCDSASLSAVVAAHKERLRCQRHVLQLYLKLADYMHEQNFCHSRLLEVQARHREVQDAIRRLSARRGR